MNIKNNKIGFTLIEMLIAVSIFSLVLIAATNIYLIINNSQRKVVTLQKIQEDVRFLFDAMAQDIRLSSINYSFYQDNNLNTHPLRDGDKNTVLALVDQLDNQIYYRLSGAGNKVQYCENDCDLSDVNDWDDVTPESVEINDLRFIISPSADPFLEVNYPACNINDDCPVGYACSGTECKYFNDGGNFQPKVIMSIYSRGVGKNIAEESELVMQSTISTRIFSGQIENLNL